jgi:hypothetical protein
MLVMRDGSNKMYDFGENIPNIYSSYAEENTEFHNMRDKPEHLYGLIYYVRVQSYMGKETLIWLENKEEALVLYYSLLQCTPTRLRIRIPPRLSDEEILMTPTSCPATPHPLAV